MMHLQYDVISHAKLTKEVWEVGDPRDRGHVSLLSYRRYTRPTNRHGWRLSHIWHWHPKEAERIARRTVGAAAISKPELTHAEKTTLMDAWRKRYEWKDTVA